jgi:hypothetical protein
LHVGLVNEWANKRGEICFLLLSSGKFGQGAKYLVLTPHVALHNLVDTREGPALNALDHNFLLFFALNQLLLKFFNFEFVFIHLQLSLVFFPCSFSLLPSLEEYESLAIQLRNGLSLVVDRFSEPIERGHELIPLLILPLNVNVFAVESFNLADNKLLANIATISIFFNGGQNFRKFGLFLLFSDFQNLLKDHILQNVFSTQRVICLRVNTFRQSFDVIKVHGLLP